MERAIEFVTNHFELVAVMVGLLAALYWVESRRAGQTVSPQVAVRLMNQSQAVVVDLRSAKEFSEGHITNAISIPFDRFKDRVSELESRKGQMIILVCKMGQHSGSIAKQLRQMGFGQVCRLSGGLSGWTGEQLPLVKS